ncbi:MAG: sulfatase-like hydrolase/transferase [Gemmataceae bacterium]|nr:sulfatase-like hydrolase/transferase [Gemmata sp.]MDW8198340.1 sulfatase-like hydrolase/transferase [Gemmataceae bacterium]
MRHTLLAGVVAGLSLATSTAAEKPNIIIILTDDQGYGDVGCYGAKDFSTPHLDKLAQQGIRFTDFYVSQPVCSASRASLLTGCYANRIGLHGALGPSAHHGLHADETTIAEICKSHGYATGIAGKWHLGHHPPFLPTRHGFDTYFGLPYSNDMWPHHPEAKKGTYPPLPMFREEKIIKANVSPDDQTQLTTQYTEFAVQFIAANKDKPFFFYLAHSMPHVPLFVSAKYKGKTPRGLYGDVIAEIDWSVGQIMKALDDHHLTEKTLVIFTSDNGPWLSYGNHSGSAGPLREGKGTVWEGGVRVPFIARWPGKIPAGSVCREPAMTIDLLPTIAAILGAQRPKRTIDGRDIGPLLRNQPNARCPHEAYFFYFGAGELQAVRSGPWKLILPHTYRTMAGQPPGRDGQPGRYQQVKIEQPELYNLDADIGETKNVAAKHPEVVEKLLALAEQARDELGDTLTRRTGRGVRPPGRIPAPPQHPPAAATAPEFSAELIFPLHPQHNHAPGIVECPNGDLLVSWYRGSGERTADDVAIYGARKKPQQKQWSKPFLLADTPGFPDCNTALWIDNNQKLWLFWPVVLANSWESCLTHYRVASNYQNDGAPQWEWQGIIPLKPKNFETVMLREFDVWKKQLSDVAKVPLPLSDDTVKKRVADKLLSRLGWQPRCKPTVLASGRILLPLYSDTYSAGIMAISDDGGKTWTASEPLAGFGSIQPAVLERRDGTVVAYMRENGVFKKIRVAESKDGGMTWGSVVSSELPNPGSGLDAVKLASGNWLLIYNDTTRGRNSLAVSLSDDEGKTWKWTRHLEKADSGSYHYPAVIQGQDGHIHAVYSYFVRDGKSMKYARFNEAWIKDGD